MKKKTLMHGSYMIRVQREENSKAGMIEITHFTTKEQTIMDIDENGVFRQRDRNNPGRKVVEKAVSTYYRLAE